MQVVIVREDNRVIVDGVSRTVDCSSLPADFHALHWSGTVGELEHSVMTCASCGGTSKKGNATVTDFSPYQKLVDAWTAAAPKDSGDAA